MTYEFHGLRFECSKVSCFTQFALNISKSSINEHIKTNWQFAALITCLFCGGVKVGPQSLNVN